MKKIILLTAAVLGTAMISCTSRNSLAKDIAGTWTGTPVSVASTQTDATITTTDTYSFTPDEGTPGGSVLLTGMISMSAPMQPTDSIMSPYSVAASANATITGTWSITDEDDMEIVLDPKSLTISVDPKALELRSNVINGEQAPRIDSIAPAMATQVKGVLTASLTNYYLGIRHLEDVKVKNNNLEFEIEVPGDKDRDVVLHRDGPTSEVSK